VQGAFLTNQGLRGLNMPPIQRYITKSPALAGSSYQNSIADERDIFWPLFVYANGESQAWVELDRKLWRSFHPEHTGIWRIIQPNGVSRYLPCRYSGDGGHAYPLDPIYKGWALYGVELVAEQPYWLGEPISQQWGAATTDDFFGGGAGSAGPPFYIVSGSTFATAEIDNPGDVSSSMVWRIDGPCTDVTVGVGTATVNVPFDLAGGEWVTIDTNPWAQTAIDNVGADRTDELGTVNWAEIPAGASVQLSLSMTGTGTVSGTLQPRYFRAW
jgi:hypothetical protein